MYVEGLEDHNGVHFQVAVIFLLYFAWTSRESKFRPLFSTTSPCISATVLRSRVRYGERSLYNMYRWLNSRCQLLFDRLAQLSSPNRLLSTPQSRVEHTSIQASQSSTVQSVDHGILATYEFGVPRHRRGTYRDHREDTDGTKNCLGKRDI